MIYTATARAIKEFDRLFRPALVVDKKKETIVIVKRRPESRLVKRS